MSADQTKRAHRLDRIWRAITDLTSEKFTGKLTVEINMRQGGLAKVYLMKKEELIEENDLKKPILINR